MVENFPQKTTLGNLVVFIALFVVTQLPLYLVRYPDIQDYPNHAARLHVALNLGASTYLSEYYRWTPGLFPNMPMDTIGLALAYLFGVELGLKLFVSLASLLAVTGAAVLGWVFNRGYSPFSLTPLLFVNGVVLYYGLFNYIFGVGLALWLISFWQYSEKMPPFRRTAWLAVGTSALYLSHLSGLAVYLLAVGTLCLYAHLRSPDSWRRLPAKVIPLVVPLLPAAIIHLLLYERGSPVVTPLELERLPLLLYKLSLLGGVVSKNVSPYPVPAILAGLAMPLAIYVLWKGRHLVMHQAAGWLVAQFLLCMCLLSPVAFGSGMVDARLVFPIILLAVSGFVWQGSQQLARGIVVVQAVLLLLISAGQYSHWKSLEPRQVELRSALRGLPEGAKLVVVSLAKSEFAGQQITEHSAAWGVIDRSALLASLWARPFQPFLIGIQPAYQASARLAQEEPAQPFLRLAKYYDFMIVFGDAASADSYAPGQKAIYSADWVRILEGLKPIVERPDFG